MHFFDQMALIAEQKFKIAVQFVEFGTDRGRVAGRFKQFAGRLLKISVTVKLNRIEIER